MCLKINPFYAVVQPWITCPLTIQYYWWLSFHCDGTQNWWDKLRSGCPGRVIGHWASLVGKCVFNVFSFSLHCVTPWFVSQELVTCKFPTLAPLLWYDTAQTESWHRFNGLLFLLGTFTLQLSIKHYCLQVFYVDNLAIIKWWLK